jgi:hypothetical protein
VAREYKVARLLPKDLPADAPHSEREVHRVLASLPNEWTVLWSIPFGRFGRGKPRFTEVDFLTLHPRFGLMAIEVKGGAVSLREGEWFTTPHGGTPQLLKRSPFVQAADARYELSRYLFDKLQLAGDVLGHAVVFPDTVVSGALGPDAPRDIIIDRNDLQAPSKALGRAAAAWETRGLASTDIKRIVELLRPSHELTVVLAAVAQAAEGGIQRETRRQVDFVESQVGIWRKLLSTNRAVVLGGAGTGKTVIAASRAKRLASVGEKTLVLCHRPAVAMFLRSILDLPYDGRSFDPLRENNLNLLAWPGLVKALSDCSGRKPVTATSADLEEFFFQAALTLPARFDAIVVDEGQEFTSTQFAALRWLLASEQDGGLFVFADPFQHSGRFSVGNRPERRSLLRRIEWEPPFREPMWLLSHNCRNTIPIGALAEDFYPGEFPQTVVTGEAPIFIRADDPATIAATAVDQIVRLLRDHGFRPNQLLFVVVNLDGTVVESAARRRRLVIAPAAKVERFPLTGVDVRVMMGTADDVQGLEAEVVVVAAWASSALDWATARDIYVAATRARSLLFVISNGLEADLRTQATSLLGDATLVESEIP